jgi:hypothetical protein
MGSRFLETETLRNGNPDTLNIGTHISKFTAANL